MKTFSGITYCITIIIIYSIVGSFASILIPRTVRQCKGPAPDRPPRPPPKEDVSVITDENTFQVTANLSTYSTNEISVNIIDGDLIIQAKQAGIRNDRTHAYDEFIKKISLPTGIDVKQLKASLSDGILTVTAPRRILPDVCDLVIPVIETASE